MRDARDSIDQQRSAGVALELRALRGEVAELREAVEYLARQLLARDDRRRGAVVLPLAAELLGDGAAFSAGELLAAALEDRGVVGQALHEELHDMVAEDAAGGVATVGRFLSRLAGVRLGGYRLTVTQGARQPYRVRGSAP